MAVGSAEPFRAASHDADEEDGLSTEENQPMTEPQDAKGTDMPGTQQDPKVPMPWIVKLPFHILASMILGLIIYLIISAIDPAFSAWIGHWTP